MRGVCRNVELDKYTHIKHTQTFTQDAHVGPTYGAARTNTRRAIAFQKMGREGGGAGGGSCDRQHALRAVNTSVAALYINICGISLKLCAHTSGKEKLA